MKVWINTKFVGHYPVGTSAVVVAKTAKSAAGYLERELTTHGLSQKIDPSDMECLLVAEGIVRVLQNGDY